VPDHIKHAILTLPHAYAPRLDFAIHLRTQFHHFEQQASVDDPAYKKEVMEWLNSSECKMVFSSLESKLLEQFQILRPPLPVINTSLSREEESPDPVYVYLAADNEDVKDKFASILAHKKEFSDKMKIMRVETRFIFHVKNLARLKSETDNEGLMDLVFDWYALSLANNIFSWRKGSTHLVSTFVHSAQKVQVIISLPILTLNGLLYTDRFLVRQKGQITPWGEVSAPEGGSF
jgi:hypothetical protein